MIERTFFPRGGRWMPAAVALWVVFCGAGVRSQVPKATNGVPPMDVHTLAQRADKHYNHLHSLKAGFSESYDGMGVNRTEAGTLLLEKPGRSRWDYSSPRGKVFLLDGKYAWFYAPGDAHVQRMKAKDLDDLRSPLRFLLGHTKLEKEFNHLELAAANGEYTLTGQPKGDENRVARVTLTLKPDGTITRIEIEETDGAMTRFAFTGEVANAPFPAGTFKFVPPAGVPIVDGLPPV
jgi:outer membrane lipoprotein carrier protein